MATHSSIPAWEIPRREELEGLQSMGLQKNCTWLSDLKTTTNCILVSLFWLDFPSGSGSKVSAYNAEDLGSTPGSGRSPGDGNGNPLQYSCLENPMDRGAWQATVHGVSKSQMRLSHFIFFSLSLF